ncbi:MAG: DUF1971 domain-containing protein [Parvularculales bacterium]
MTLDEQSLPEGAELIRRTDEYRSETFPAGFRRDHLIKQGVWGVLRVEEGSMFYEDKEAGEKRIIEAGQYQVIKPETVHCASPLSDNTRCFVEFYEVANK